MTSKAKAVREKQREEAPKESGTEDSKFGSKTVLIAVIVLVVLAVAAVLFFGGFLQQAGTEQEAIAFADSTAFGKVAGFYGGLFESAKNCGFDKFISLAEKQAGVTATEEEKAKMRPYFESAGKCMPFLAKKAEKEQDWKFSVLYSFEMPASCDDNEIAGLIEENRLGIGSASVKVDLKEKKAEMPPVPEGASFDSWDKELEDIETSVKKAEATAGKDSRAMMECSVVDSMAMYKYTLDALEGMGELYGQ